MQVLKFSHNHEYHESVVAHTPFFIATTSVVSVMAITANVPVQSNLLRRRKGLHSPPRSPLCSSPAEASSDRPHYKELHKLYVHIFLKEHKRVGVAFQNQQQEMEELDESNKDAEELVNLVQTKSEATKTLQTKLA